MKQLKDYLINFINEANSIISFTIKEYFQNIDKYSNNSFEYNWTNKAEDSDQVTYYADIQKFCKKLLSKPIAQDGIISVEMEFEDATLFGYKENYVHFKENSKTEILKSSQEMRIEVITRNNHKFSNYNDNHFYIFNEKITNAKEIENEKGINMPFKTYKDLMNNIINVILNKMPNIK